MKDLERLLDIWVELPPRQRALLMNLAEAFLDRPSNRPTVVIKRPIELRPKPKHCPECQDVITNRVHKYCPKCGCMLPEWTNWPETEQ